jgi:hypothetical protein
MKKLLTLTSIVALLVAGGAKTVSAQDMVTNEVVALNYQLTMVLQGPTTTSRTTVTTDVQKVDLTSADIIQALGTATGNTFSRNAQLELLTPMNSLDYWAWTVRVQDGSNSVDVTGFFTHQPGNAVGSATANTRNGNVNATTYSDDTFGIVDSGGFPSLSLHFSGDGFTTAVSDGVVTRGKVVGQIDRITADLSGTGDYQGNFAVVKGTLSGVGIGTALVPARVAAN